MDDRGYEVSDRNNRNQNSNAGPIWMIVGGALLLMTGGGAVVGIVLMAVGINKLSKQKAQNNAREELPNRYFSQRLIPAMRKAFGESFMVDRRGGISADHVWKSGLFVKQTYCERRGIAGAKYRGLDIRIGWIETYETERTQDISGQFYYARVDRFRGILLTLQTKQEAPCALKILGNDYPDKGELCEPGMCRMILGEDEFDRNFLLFTDNARALETLLTPEHCKALLRLMDLCGSRKFGITWRGHLCYAAWDSYSNQLDAPVAVNAQEEEEYADRAVYYITDFVDTCGSFIW